LLAKAITTGRRKITKSTNTHSLNLSTDIVRSNSNQDQQRENLRKTPERFRKTSEKFRANSNKGLNSSRHTANPRRSNEQNNSDLMNDLKNKGTNEKEPRKQMRSLATLLPCLRPQIGT
jgi:GTP cyclohydrolase I